MVKKKMCCDTCGREVDQLRRDVLDASYNAFNKPLLWNCQKCYLDKRTRRGDTSKVV